MKRTFLHAFCILILCSLFLLVNVGATRAYVEGYSYVEYDAIVIMTLDGKWTSSNEWTDAPWMNISATARFGGKIDLTTGTFQQNIVEFFSDNTNDAGDYWQICMHNTDTGPTAPTTDSYRWDIVGHTTLVGYQGNGTGWNLLATPPAGFTWANSISASPLNSTPHWTLEFQIDKTVSPINAVPPIGLRVAMYDASNAAAGVQAWPPTDRDNPSQWGSISGYGGGPIPEGLSIGVVVLLSSVAVIVGSYYLRKRPKTTNHRQIKL